MERNALQTQAMNFEQLSQKLVKQVEQERQTVQL
jgi:hypothetical protein